MDRPTLGLIEEVELRGPKKRKALQARIDTGAMKSSLDTSLAMELGLGPAHKERLIKSASGSRLRPIVQATVVIAGKEITDEFSLADRSHLSYPVLIGQSILIKGRFLIDPLKERGRQDG